MKRILAALAAGVVLAAGITAVTSVDAHAANGLKVLKANGLKASTSHNALRRGPENEL